MRNLYRGSAGCVRGLCLGCPGRPPQRLFQLDALLFEHRDEHVVLLLEVMEDEFDLLLGFDVDPLNTVHFSNHTGKRTLLFIASSFTWCSFTIDLFLYFL